MNSEVIHISLDQAGGRLDKLLALHYPAHSRTYFQGLIDQGLVFLNGAIPKKRARLEAGDEVEITFASVPKLSIEPEAIPLDILYEDEWMLAVNKPAGMVVHPAKGHWDGTFVNALLHHCKELPGDDLRPGIVHRLDKETSGVLLAAKTREAQMGLVEGFAKRKIEKEYLAISVGNPGNCVMEGSLARHPKDRKRFAITEGGKSATTECELLGTDGKLSLLRLRPKTGRTHQIRVHLQSRGTPILGDAVYGKRDKMERQMLHALRYSLAHPITGERLEIKAPLPSDLANIAQSLVDCSHAF